MSSNHSTKAAFRCITSVARLERRLDDCIGSEDYVVVIRALVATRKPAAVRVLASLLDSTGPIAEESIAGLVHLGETLANVVPAMQACTDSDDYETIRHAHRVLAALGHGSSQAWIDADDRERIEAYLERKGLTSVELAERIAGNETEEGDEEGVA
jgi:hypothetical protein